MAKKKRSFRSANQKNRQRRKKGRKWLNIPTGVQQFKEEAGKRVNLDILPYVVSDPSKHPDKKDIPDDIWWKFPYMVHRSVGPDNDDIICPGTLGKPCPMCEERQAIYDDVDADNEDAKDLKASRRTLYAVRQLKGRKKTESDVMIWDISDYCFLEQLDIELEDSPEEYEDFAAPEGGYTLKIRFIEKKIGKDVAFPMAQRVDFEERDDIEDEFIDEEVPCLDDIISVPSYEEARALYLGEEIEDEAEDEDSGGGKSSKKSNKKSGKKSGKKSEKKEKKKSEPDPEPDPELDWDELKDMDEDDLVDYAEDNDIELDEDMDEDDIRKAIAKDLDIEIPKKKKKKKEKKEKKSGKKADKKKDKKKKSKKDECPFAYKFGEDFEEHEECDEEGCEMYEKCFDAYNESS